jgi:hypothetical protein
MQNLSCLPTGGKEVCAPQFCVMKAKGLVGFDGPFDNMVCHNIMEATAMLYNHVDRMPNSYQIDEVLAILSSCKYNMKNVPF